MPAVARKSGTDTISTSHVCTVITVTDQGSGDVLVNNIGVVRQGDLNEAHSYGPPYVKGNPTCGALHQVPLSSFSPTVFANNKNIGRIGDAYGGETIISGSANVFANG